MERKLYELTQAQQVVIYGMRFTKNKGILNIALEFQIENDIDLHTLMQAVNLTVLRNPNNRLRIISKDKKIYQYFSDEAQEKIEYLEFDDEKNYEKYIKKFAQTAFPNDLIDTQLYRVSVIKKPNSKYAICGCFAHLIYDSYSSAMFFKEVFDIYCAIIQDKPLPKETISPISAYEAQEKYLTSKKRELDAKFYEEEFFTEPQYTVLSGKKSKTFSIKERTGLREAVVCPRLEAHSLTIPIENEFRDKVYKYASDNQITPQIIYMLACRTYLSYVCETNDVTIDSTINKRSTIIEQKAGGTLADSIKFRTVFDNNISFKEGIDKVHSKLLDHYKHSYFSVQAVEKIIEKKHNTPKTRKYSSVIFTYQPPTQLSKDIKYSFKRLPNGREWIACYINIIPHNSENEYVVDYSCMPKIIKEETIRDYHKFMINFINEGIENDNQTINDIIGKIGR